MLKSGRDNRSVHRAGSINQCVDDKSGLGDLVGSRIGGASPGGRGCCCCRRAEISLQLFGLLLLRTEARDLVVGAKPAHEASLFLLRPLIVERNEAREYLILR